MLSRQQFRHFHTVPLGTVLPELPAIASWFESQWPDWYGPAGPGDAMEDLTSWCDDNALPLARVALSDEGRVLGIAALKTGGLGEEHGLGPFLSALYVSPRHRCLGVGASLVRAIEEAASVRGFPALYGTTDGARGLLRHLGWRDTGLVSSSERGNLSIFCKAFSS